jgi:Fe-S cluster biogenesis protein NfuA
MKEKIEKVLREKVNPMLAMHGGGCELIEVTEDKRVKVRLTGACCGCPSARASLAGIVESVLKEKVDGIKGVEGVF